MPRPKTMILTGGRGRLATLIADHFRAPTHAMRLFSRVSGPGFGDLRDLHQKATFSRTHVVLHLAWSTLPATAEQHPRSEWETDLPFLEKMLAAMSAVPASARVHFIFFSSGGTVYGNAPGRPSLESDVCAPAGWHGRAKRAAEEIIEAHAARHGLACAILRISNPYGYPVPKSRAQGIIPHALRCSTERQPLTLFGDGQAKKDFLYHSDLISALELVIDRRLTGTYNICAGQSHTVREIIGLVELNTGRPVALRYQPAAPWDVQDSRLDHSRFVAATGWAPQVSLTEGLRRAAAGYADH